MASGLHVIQIGKGGNFSQWRDASTAHHRHAQVVNQLFGNEEVCVPHGVEDFARGERSSGVLANDAKSLLQFCRYRIFQPKQMVGFNLISETSRLDRRKSMMRIVQKVDIVPEPGTQRLKELGNVIEILLC